MINYEEELNGAQLDAVRYLDGPQLVIAGAGSGKTRVLTYKIAYLLEHGFEPWSILALTFTNKAAGEMKERIAARVGERAASMLWMGTFHSVFSKILRREAHNIGYTPQFTIYDQSDSRSLVKSIVKEMKQVAKQIEIGCTHATPYIEWGTLYKLVEEYIGRKYGDFATYITHENEKQTCYYPASIEIYGRKDYKTIEVIKLI